MNVLIEFLFVIKLFSGVVYSNLYTMMPFDEKN